MILNPNKNIYTTDAEEVARFSAISAEWWDENGPFKPLHELNPTRMAFVKHAITQHYSLPSTLTPLSGLRILDIGCGGGLVAEPLCRLGGDVVGVDASDKTIEVAKAHAHLMGLEIDYRAAAVEDLDPREQFDVITALEIVEHVQDVQGFIYAVSAHLKPNGLLILSTLNRTWKAYAIAILGAEYVMRWLPIGTHQWHKFITPAELGRYCRQAGLITGESKGLSFNPLGWAWSLTNDLDVNYLITAVKA